MAETIAIGRKALFVPINPAEIVYEDGTATLINDNGGTTVVLRFAQSTLLRLPAAPCCATVEGEATLRVHVDDDAQIVGFEVIDVDDIQLFEDAPTEQRESAALSL